MKKDSTYHVFKMGHVTLDLQRNPIHCALPETGLHGRDLYGPEANNWGLNVRVGDRLNGLFGLLFLMGFLFGWQWKWPWRILALRRRNQYPWTFFKGCSSRNWRIESQGFFVEIKALKIFGDSSSTRFCTDAADRFAYGKRRPKYVNKKLVVWKYH